MPLAAAITQLADLALAVAALAVVLPLFGVRPSPDLLWILPLDALLVLFTTAAALVVNCANRLPPRRA
ncbi:MAG: hypothetical protein AB7R55_19125 [Gemmatimonadales bacterium]